MQEPDELAANLSPAAAAHPPSSTSTDTVCIDSLELPQGISMNFGVGGGGISRATSILFHR